MALTPKASAPRLALPEGDSSAAFDASANLGNKTLGFSGITRLYDFAKWVSDRPESTIVVSGHSLWFKSFFQLFLPPATDHISKKRKIVNCGVVGFTLQVVRDARGATLYRIDPASIAVVYGGFDTKGK